MPYWPYDPSLRFELPLLPAASDASLSVPTDGGNLTSLRIVGRVELPVPVCAPVRAGERMEERPATANRGLGAAR